MAEQLEHPPVLVFPQGLKAEPLEERPRSPETNCAICLEEFNNKSYTNSCFHEFCYHCLKEWSKIKPECPLCKQRFQTIIYNIRSQQEYDEYHVENSNDMEVVSQWFNQAFQRPLFRYRNTLDFRRLLIDEREFFFMPAAAAHSPPLPLTIPPPSVSLVDSQTFEHDFGSTLTLNGTRNRRDVYRHDRWVRPSASNRVRESSPEFYRWNPAQTHRLISWLSRELNVLLDVSVDPHVLCQEILNLITTYPIRSREFRDALRPTLGERANHFVHEFYHFAISPHDMVTYDVIAEYGAPGLHTYNFSDGVSSDSDSDIEVVTISGAPLIKNNLTMRQMETNCLDLTNRAGPSNAPSCFDPAVVIEISDTNSSDSEIEIIEVTPVEPEIIVIDSSASEDEQRDIQLLSSQLTKCESPDRSSSGLQSEALTSLRNLYHAISDSDVEVAVDENSSSQSGTPKAHSQVLSPSTSEQSYSAIPEYNTRYHNSSASVGSSSSNMSSMDASMSDSDSSEYDRKRTKHKKKRKRISSSSRHGHERKRFKRVYIKSPVSSSDEDYVPVPRNGAPLVNNVMQLTERNYLDLINRAGSSNAPSCFDPAVVIEISDANSSDNDIEIIEVAPVEPETIVIDSSASEDEQRDLQMLPSQITKCESPDRNSSGLQNQALTSLCNLYHTVSDPGVEVAVNEISSSQSGTPKVHSQVLSPSTSEQFYSASPEYSTRFHNSSASVGSSSSNLSSMDSSMPDADSLEYDRKRMKHKKKRKRISSSSRHNHERKRVTRVYIKSPVSSSDEDYVPVPSVSRPCHLKSVVVKPECEHS